MINRSWKLSCKVWLPQAGMTVCPHRQRVKLQPHNIVGLAVSISMVCNSNSLVCGPILMPTCLLTVERVSWNPDWTVVTQPYMQQTGIVMLFFSLNQKQPSFLSKYELGSWISLPSSLATVTLGHPWPWLLVRHSFFLGFLIDTDQCRPQTTQKDVQFYRCCDTAIRVWSLSSF